MKNSCSGIKEDWCCKAFALTGRLADCYLPRALPWARSFCPFRACCLRLACVLLLLFPSAEEIKLLKAEM